MGKRDFPDFIVTSTFYSVYIYEYVRNKVVIIDEEFNTKLREAEMKTGTHTAEELIEALEV